MAVSSCLGRFCFLMAAGKNGYYAGRTFLCAEAASHTGVLIDHCVGTLKHGKGLAGTYLKTAAAGHAGTGIHTGKILG